MESKTHNTPQVAQQVPVTVFQQDKVYVKNEQTEPEAAGTVAS